MLRIAVLATAALALALGTTALTPFIPSATAQPASQPATAVALPRPVGPDFADLAARVAQHRAGKGAAFCRRYGLKRLVLAEPYPTIDEAIAREKAMKEWHRAWKIRRIEEDNPAWDDLWTHIIGA